MGDLSKHFSKREFACKCGKVHEFTMDGELIDKLEKLHALTNARAIYITSGYRCPAHSKAVGGYMNDAHTKGIAADITITLQDGKSLSGDKIAEGAERVGFTGIGIITDTACHVDVRNSKNYVNSHWFGDERTGNDNISTFQKGTVFDGEKTAYKHKIKVYYDDTLIIEREV